MAVSGPVTRTSDDNAEPEPVECELCRYWVQLTKGNGVCHRYPPAIASGSREIRDYGWCGEFRPKATEAP